MVDLLQSDLLDIEVDLQKALKKLTERFIVEVGAINTDMQYFTEELFKEVRIEMTTFSQNLKEHCIAEFDGLQRRV